MSSLSNLKVLDLTSHLSGPYCAMILADHGADVVKIEKPNDGDQLRKTPPFQSGESAPFMLWNRNKRSVTLDLKDFKDHQLLLKMVEAADIMIENFKPGTASRLGIDYVSVSKINPALIYCSISGFGQTGPYAPRGGFDLIACGMSGLMSINGPPDGPPYRIPMPVSDVCGGMNGAIGILTALAARNQTGRGQHVDTSLFESGISLGVYEAANVFANGEVPERLGQAHRGSAPYQLFPTSDGYVTVGGAQDNFWRGTCKILDCEQLVEDPRFKSKAERVANNKVLVSELEVFFRRQSTSKLCKAFDEAGIPAGPVMNHVEVYNDPQTLAREMVVEVEHSKLGQMKTIGIPVKLSDTPGKITRSAPLLGEHNKEVLKDWGLE
ncbi:MAG: CoA transferase [Rhodospirillaceae bacterium]|jgi:crotonobetainyl-CoA:carnitine CoA-transferase CaiB-like acyl-CoA transferase|nr:CoA transferase [Rhodospirillaceae bacterium]MDC0998677.1 CoA transferase [Alphaproteobacteria bacterium]MBT4355924.1 CoA transferase [Rhodospirillaceae bacterium]MBT5913660.1 CoA transferase [Rhodospirillaceae bacterium]MBT6305713.1 CoA transferase [Rhodospirillaceae bacterium]